MLKNKDYYIIVYKETCIVINIYNYILPYSLEYNN